MLLTAHASNLDQQLQFNNVVCLRLCLCCLQLLEQRQADLLEATLGWPLFTEGEDRLGWLMNFTTVGIYICLSHLLQLLHQHTSTPSTNMEKHTSASAHTSSAAPTHCAPTWHVALNCPPHLP
jgi:hypothetical protein